MRGTTHLAPGCLAAGVGYPPLNDKPWALPPAVGKLAPGLSTPTGREWKIADAFTLRVEEGRFVDFRSSPDWVHLLWQLQER